MSHSVSHRQPASDPLVGLLAFQGAVAAHRNVCVRLGVSTREIRTRDDLRGCTHLILPGGESTTFLKLLDFHDLSDSLKAHAQSGRPILATCAGLIFISREVLGPSQATLGLVDIGIERNAYGRQVDSFETELSIPILGPEPFHGVFIRAPIIRSVGESVETLASYEGNPIFIRQGNVFGTTFHPELSGDTRLHEFFLSAG